MTKPTPHYYPFGSLISNRSWSDVSRVYRYGFNGKEKDFETSSDNYDFGARIYDERIGRWLSLDPLMNNFPYFSPFIFSKNSPILYNDPNGKSAKITINADGSVVISAKIMLYGPAIGKLTDNDVNNLASNIETMLNQALKTYIATNGGIMVDGKLVTDVRFSISAEKVSDETAINGISCNTNTENNYLEVVEGEGTSFMELNSEKVTNPEDGSITKVNEGGNTGVLKLDEMYDQGGNSIGLLLDQTVIDLCNKQGTTGCTQPIVSTTPLHEFLHGLGLLNPADGGDNYFHSSSPGSNGKFNIMSGRHGKVNSYNRTPDNSTIAALHLEKLTFIENPDGTKTASIGQTTDYPSALKK